MTHKKSDFVLVRDKLVFARHRAHITAGNAATVFSVGGHLHPVVPMSVPAPSGLYRDYFKRLFDISFVVATLPITLPLIGLAALALWIEGGNPFYTQQRRGFGGRAFSILKLRTMVRDADACFGRILANDPELKAEWESTQKLKNDPRITTVGRFLRRSSLDELPQFFNVLFGQMSVVGPRPMMPEQHVLYGDSRHYDAMRPGITGQWQVSRRNESNFAERLDLDAEYDVGLSFGTDVSLILKTIGVVFSRTGH